MVQSIFSFKKISNKRQYGSTHIVFQENFHQKKIWFNPYCLLRKTLTKRQYGSTHIVFQENFHQKAIRFKPYCLLRKF